MFPPERCRGAVSVFGWRGFPILKVKPLNLEPHHVSLESYRMISNGRTDLRTAVSLLMAPNSESSSSSSAITTSGLSGCL